jgi:LysR family glycine cleavage system transcriptional activator
MKRPLRSAPLNGLRAFEAAARHRSFTAAADELFVTPGAISHQIASLEAFLGMKLFLRGARSVTLTDAARDCLPLLTRGFESLHEAVDALAHRTGVPPLTVTVAPAFASRWLLPRLATFTQRHPEFEVRFATGEGVVDVVRNEASGRSVDHSLDAGPTDVSIRFGRGVYPGLVCEKLFDAEVTAVCAPSLMPGLRAGDLRGLSLIHDDTVYFDDPRTDWVVWLAAAGLDGVDASRGPRFSHTGLALDAAEDGVGLALGITALTTERPRATSLVGPVPFTLRSSFSYYLVYSREMRGDAALNAFRSWVLAEAGRGP